MPWEKFKEQQPDLWREYSESMASSLDIAPTAPKEKPAKHEYIVPPGARIERTIPYRAQSFESDVIVPVTRALFAGIFVAVVAFVVSRLTHADTDTAIVVSLGAGSLVAALWYFMDHEHNKSIMWVMETITGTDINRDGIVGKPRRNTNFIVKKAQQDATIALSGLSLDWDMVEDFIVKAEEDNFSRLTLEQADDVGLSRSEWDAIVTFLMSCGLATPKRQGVDAKLRVTAKEAIGKLAEN